MHPLVSHRVGKYPGGGGSMPVSSSSNVNLSHIPGGCGSIIPKFKPNSGEQAATSFRKDPLWCGMKSESLPGFYFMCSECMGKLDQE